MAKTPDGGANMSLVRVIAIFYLINLSSNYVMPIMPGVATPRHCQ